MNLPRRQHYIPQFLLKQFGTGKAKRVNVFDKSTGRTFLAGTTKVAVRKNIYNIEKDGYVASIEPSLSDLEGKWAPILKKILRRDSLRDLSILDKVHLSVLIVHLRLRSPNSDEFRATMLEGIRERVRSLGGDPDEIEQTRHVSPEEDKLLSIQLIQSLPGKIAPELVMKRWALHSTVPSRSLYFSDNPVILNNSRPAPQGLGNLGFAVPGIEVYLPISSTRCLAVYCPSHFGGPTEISAEPIDPMLVDSLLQDQSKLSQILNDSHPPVNDGKPLALPEESVLFLNSQQVRFAERYLFAAMDDFVLAERMIDEYKELRSGPRPVVT
ncbi:MAG: DUF4238 domain-containing protein [Deltaproteobacteria bacterium]|nr:DUF4238 domain-containing protein [Deltaproteobacteria bacterium]